MAGRGILRLGNIGGDQVLGGSSGSLEGGYGMAGGGNHQLWTKRGKLLADVKVAEMVRRQVIRAPK